MVNTKTGIPVKIVFVRNRNRQSECLYILSTNCSLNNALEFQSPTCDAMVSHTAIVFIRYTVLEWIHRNENDQKAYGELFFMFCEDIQDMD